jgi:DNA-binding transcriptional MocR family regulator
MQRTFLIVAQEILADQRISANAKLLLAQLLDHRNKRTGQCNPWETSLAEELGISRCTVMRGLKELSLAGWIRTKRGQNGNQYKFPKSQNATSQVANPNMESRKSALGAGVYPYMNLNNEPYKEPALRASGVSVCDAAASSPKTKPQPAVPRKPIRKSVLDIFYERYATDEQRKARPKS